MTWVHRPMSACEPVGPAWRGYCFAAMRSFISINQRPFGAKCETAMIIVNLDRFTQRFVLETEVSPAEAEYQLAQACINEAFRCEFEDNRFRVSNMAYN